MSTWSQSRSTKAKSVDRALSCILGVTKRDVFWGLPNMYPESYDCGLPGHFAVMRAAMMEPGVHTMSYELILQISGNISWLLNEYQWWDQAKIYHIIRQLSHRFMCEIVIWSGDKTKLIYKKTFPQDYDYELLNLRKTKIPITIVMAQMPSNPNQKSRTRDNNSLHFITWPKWRYSASWKVADMLII